MNLALPFPSLPAPPQSLFSPRRQQSPFASRFNQSARRPVVFKVDADGFFSWLEKKVAHNLFYEGPDSFNGRIKSGKYPSGASTILPADVVGAPVSEASAPAKVAKPLELCTACSGKGTVVTTVFENLKLMERFGPCVVCNGVGKV
mmetsp:Transcript_4470/g.6921  ORF Transcript_4470/g.6921 Transcript_4470/m.6921 type:complete len:146 (+) Transcript_4470:120-557(+)